MASWNPAGTVQTKLPSDLPWGEHGDGAGGGGPVQPGGGRFHEGYYLEPSEWTLDIIL